MNYLAHAYLSFGDEEILVGNMISDFIKGKKQFDYPVRVQKGITLHRAIDRYTDEHRCTKDARQYFHPAVNRYSGAFVDVVYDHFLALDELNWGRAPLPEFATGVYDILEKHTDGLPERFRYMLPYMKSQDWLSNYRFTWGIEKSFEGVARRAVYLNNAAAAFDAFNVHYPVLQQLSQSFLADVKKFALLQFNLLMQP